MKKAQNLQTTKNWKSILFTSESGMFISRDTNNLAATDARPGHSACSLGGLDIIKYLWWIIDQTYRFVYYIYFNAVFIMLSFSV